MTQADLQPLRQVLRGLGDELRRTEPPAALGERIFSALQAAPARTVAVLSPTPALQARAAPRGMGAGAMAMGVLAVVFVGSVWWATTASSQAVRASPFVALVSEQRLRQLAREPLDQGPPWVVATELPRERLAAFGLPFDPARAGESVRAELLMHPGGEVLAVRIVP